MSDARPARLPITVLSGFLLAEVQRLAGELGWRSFTDPFPVWQFRQ
jgi:hypothetical protein